MSLQERINKAEEKLNAIRSEISILKEEGRRAREERDALLLTQAVINKLSEMEMAMLGIHVDDEGNISQEA